MLTLPQPIRPAVDQIDQIKARAGLAPYSSRLKLTPSSGNYKALCPFHDDHTPSLTVYAKELRHHCFACGADGDALDLIQHVDGCDLPTARRRVEEAAGTPARPKIENVYKYTDEAGLTLFQVVRSTGKKFQQRKPNGRGGWIYKLDGVRKPLYLLPEVIAASEVYFVEGEKDAETVRASGRTATTAAGGANAPWLPEYTETLKGKKVLIVPDNDGPGRKRAQQVYAELEDAADVRIIEVPAPHKDVTDYVEAGGSIADLKESAINVPAPDRGTAPHRLGDEPEPLDEAAFHGIAGEVVRLIEPNTEASNAALLIQFLTMFGCILGRGAHFVAEATKHFSALFAVVIGDTAKARKGSSLNHIKRIFERIDSDFMQQNQASGLSSGEGLISRVRDPVLNEEGEIVKPGVTDKRLLVVEDELARALKVADRQGNVVSAIMRQAWDGSPLQTMVVTNPLKATGALISIIAHITREELLSVLCKTDIANGFANRFLWIFAKRSKTLPFGGSEYDVEPIAEKLRAAVAKARKIDRVDLDDAAKAIWGRVYESLSEAHPGDLGRVTSRSEPQTLRLALVYALLDGSDVIRAAHLQAGLAVWKYAEQSAAYIFNPLSADPTARKILEALEGGEGRTRTQLYNDLGTHVRSADIARTLDYLQRQGIVSSVKDSTGGRPKETWLLCGESGKSGER